MRMRVSKVRITDNRAPGAGARPALERRGATRGGSMTGLDYLSAAQAREAAEHDKAIRDYDENTLLAVAGDLGKRRAWDRKDAEQRWVMARKAAVLRKLDREGALQ